MPNAIQLHITTREAQDALRFQSLDGTSAFLRRHGVTPHHRGRALLWPRQQVLNLVLQHSLEAGDEKEVRP
jgi:hypothetical protein